MRARLVFWMLGASDMSANEVRQEIDIFLVFSKLARSFIHHTSVIKSNDTDQYIEMFLVCRVRTHEFGFNVGQFVKFAFQPLHHIVISVYLIKTRRVFLKTLLLWPLVANPISTRCPVRYSLLPMHRCVSRSIVIPNKLANLLFSFRLVFWKEFDKHLALNRCIENARLTSAMSSFFEPFHGDSGSYVTHLLHDRRSASEDGVPANK